MAVYSDTPLARKLGLDRDVVFTVVGAPDGFATALGDHDAVWQHSLLAPLDAVIAFFTSRERLKAQWSKLTSPLAPAGALWVVWPKQPSSVATDLTGDIVRATLAPTGWVDTKVCAIDDTWSGLRFVLRQDLRPGERAGKRPRDRPKR